MKRLAKVILFLTVLSVSLLYADENSENLAKKLANPISSLISVPLVYSYDTDFGLNDDGSKSVLNIQPVIPMSLNSEWNVISRTIVPLVYQDDIITGTGSQSGLGDILQSFFFSPKKPTSGGIVWGVGPAILLPTASDDLLGGGKWGLGPTVVVLKQNGPWTIGGIANHIWSVAGDDDRGDISNTFLQPFVAYTTPKAVTFTLNTESTYNWETEQWSIPINAQVSKLIKIGKQPVSIGLGVRYWADSPAAGPEGWGLSLNVKLLFPK